MVLVLKFWKPQTIMRLEGDKEATIAPKKHSGGEVFVAWLPYLLLVVFVLTWGEVVHQGDPRPVHERAAAGFLPLNPNVLNGINVPGLHNLITRVPPVTPAPAPYGAVFTLNWLSASGTACFLAGVAAAILLRVKPSSSRPPTSPPSSS